MKNVYIYIAFSSLFLFIGCKRDLTDEEIYNHYNEAVNKAASINYTVRYQNVNNKGDTIQVSGTCWVERIPDDTVMGKIVKTRRADGLIKVYDGHEYMEIIPEIATVRIENPAVQNRKLFNEGVFGKLYVLELVDGVSPSYLKDWGLTFERDRKLETPSQYVLKMRYREEAFINGWFSIWINKETFLPEKILKEQSFMGDTQRIEIIISDLEINKSEIGEEIRHKDFGETYKIVRYTPPDKKEDFTLPNNSEAPDFYLTDLSGNPVSISGLRGKIILLDFWFMSCKPCKEAMPYLESLHQKYGSKGLVVIGVNPADLRVKSELPGFLTEHGVTYQTVLDNESVSNLYNVRAYPTLYLIDKKGKIIYAEIGFSATTLDKLTQLIEQQL